MDLIADHQRTVGSLGNTGDGFAGDHIVFGNSQEQFLPVLPSLKARASAISLRFRSK